MTAAKLKRGQLVRVCKSALSYEDGISTLPYSVPKGYSPLTWEEKQAHGDRKRSLLLSEMLTYTGGTHKTVKVEPGDLVTVIKGSTRTGGPWRENFTVVMCPRLGYIYYIKKEFLETISESS